MGATLGNLFEVLSASEALMSRAEIAVPGMSRGIVFEYEITSLKQRQAFLRNALEKEAMRAGGNLGFPVIAAVVLGGGALVSILGSWIYKNYSDTKRVQARIDVYDQMIKDGISPDKAADTVYGRGSEVGSVLNKLILLSVIGAGVLLYIKMK